MESFINPRPERPPSEHTVGYVGNLGHRVDWELVEAVAEACSSFTFVFAGGLSEGPDPDGKVEWEQTRARVLERSNVEHLGRIPQDEVTEVYWNSAVNWIPYDTTHPFNRASCPTKIMDGLASGRPLLSTDVPECRLYPEWIDIADTADKMVKALHEYTTGERSHSAHEQVVFSKKHTWVRRVREFREIVKTVPSYSRS
jgi:glycosyltransferase involved in cell wall biosynthesis